MGPQRYRLASDNDGHHYVIPVEREEDWYAFTDIPEGDPRGWDVPSFAVPLDGSPTNISFTDWRQE